ncbi:MAG: 2-oxo acid dehydrogenase subunit E2 [Phycisphaerales bacterium]|nr:MAG: 2-oxo acid dehydrogenase subunit E2 [Phycisphaerales bacterium]
MPREFTLPDLGEGISEAQIVRVLVKDGDVVTEDQYLMEVETDKAAVEIPSPYAGVVGIVHVHDGQTVHVGDVIVTFDDAAEIAPTAAKPAAATVETPAAPAKEPPAAPPPRKTTAPAAPAVRKLARELGVNLDAITGTGPGGRITRQDVERDAAAPQEMPPAPTPTAVPRRPPPPVTPPPGIADTDKWGPVRREPLNQIRKTIAKQMSRSASTIPHVTHTDEADITELDRMRRDLNQATNNDPKMTAMTFVIRATCMALRKYPIFNASFDEDGEQIIYKEYINIGVAVDTERGLIVPVVRNADQLSLRAIAYQLRTIADRIRATQFGIEDLRGGTFTITNVGALGGLFTTPIINHPEVAILALGRSRKVPTIQNDDIQESLVLPVNLSFDHRATDGANAARFTKELISYLETPAKFLLD